MPEMHRWRFEYNDRNEISSNDLGGERKGKAVSSHLLPVQCSITALCHSVAVELSEQKVALTVSLCRPLLLTHTLHFPSLHSSLSSLSSPLPHIFSSPSSSSSSLAFCLFSTLDSDSNDGEQGKGFSVELRHKPLCTQNQHSLLAATHIFFSFFMSICVFHCNQAFSLSVLHQIFY